MDLDGVELILRIEDEFSINISEDEATAARTVGDWYDLVLEKLRTSSSRASNMALYRTKRAVVEVLQLPRRSVRPSTWLDPLLPPETRIARWKEIADRTGMEFPGLRHVRKWRDGFILLSMLLSTALVLVLWWSLYSLGWLPGALKWLFLAPACAAWLVLASRINNRLLIGTPRLAYEIPFKTAGELATAVLALNYEVLEGRGKMPLSAESIWLRIVDVLCDELRVGPDEVRRGTRMLEDLGVS
jgi:hypothetical protein